MNRTSLEENIIKNNATEVAEAFVYQFLVALDYCFKLKEGETLYFECYGDVSISKEEQIEVKKYKKPLTNYSENFWKTLVNWLDKNFENNHYKKLLLLTTQNISSYSKLTNWNTLNAEQKLKRIEELIKNYHQRKRKSTRLLKYFEIIIKIDKNILKNVLEKFEILDKKPETSTLFKQISEIWGKGVENNRKVDFINDLLGFLIKHLQNNDNKKWSISYEGFNKKVSERTQLYVPNSYIFPNIIVNEVNVEEFREKKFVRKIGEIKLENEISPAICDFLRAIKFYTDELRYYNIPKESVKVFQKDVEEQYLSKRRQYINKFQFNKNVMKISQEFYYDVINSPCVFGFPNFTATPNYIRNGTLHQITDETDEYRWLIAND